MNGLELGLLIAAASGWALAICNGAALEVARDRLAQAKRTIVSLKQANRALASHARTLEHTARVIDLDARRKVREAQAREVEMLRQRDRMQRQLATVKWPTS